jgi:copper chaperone CopZ
MRRFLLSMMISASLVATAWAEDPKAETTQATFLITGLHCPPCTKTVEGSLRRAKGVQSVTVDWRTKNAKIKFDESKLSAQSLTQLIHSTPHMMGGGMQYEGWLALKVDGLKDEKTAATAKAALTKVPGVAKVAVYAGQGSVGVQFDAKAKTTSTELIEALKADGITAANLK